MNMNLISLFGDFRKLSDKVTNEEEAMDTLLEEFCVDKEEVQDLNTVFVQMILELFDIRKLNKKQKAQVELVLALMYDSFLFGMFIANNEYWNWPKR